MGDQLDPILIRTFLAVVDEGGFGAAGRRLNSVQSNVTARVRRLEAELGQRLLDRGQAGATLTPYGRVAEVHLRDLMGQIEATHRLLRDAAGQAVPLRLGAMETTAATRLPALLAELRHAYPDAPVSVRTGTTATLLELIWRRELDAAFVAGPVDPDRFWSTHAFDETLVALGSWSVDGPTALYAFPEGCNYRTVAEAWLRHEGRHVIVTEMGSLDGMVGCVASGLGVLVAPSRALDGRVSPDLPRTSLPAGYGNSITVLAMRHDALQSQTLEKLKDVLGSPL